MTSRDFRRLVARFLPDCECAINKWTYICIYVNQRRKFGESQARLVGYLHENVGASRRTYSGQSERNLCSGHGIIYKNLKYRGRARLSRRCRRSVDRRSFLINSRISSLLFSRPLALRSPSGELHTLPKLFPASELAGPSVLMSYQPRSRDPDN